MKKQIFIFLIAIIGISTNVLAQSLKNGDGNLTSAPSYCPPVSTITATCIQAPGPLNPTLGQTYTYSVTVNPAVALPGTIHWFATIDPNFITAGALNTASIEDALLSPYIISAGASYNQPTTNISPDVTISWESVPVSGYIFLVTYVKDNNGCTDNIKVYKIMPQHVFMLDMAYMSAAGTSTTQDDDCVAPVFDATYDAGADEVIMDFGINHIFFVINASSYAHSWLPKFELDVTSGLTATSILAVDWAYPTQASGVGAVWHPTFAAGNIYTSGVGGATPTFDPVLPTGGAPAVGEAGECIIVRVTIDHNKNEALANIPFTFAVDGVMYDQVAANYLNAAKGDIHYAANPGGGPCPWIDGFENDVLSYTLTLRPTVTDAIPDPALPALPTDFIDTDAD